MHFEKISTEMFSIDSNGTLTLKPQCVSNDVLGDDSTIIHGGSINHECIMLGTETMTINSAISTGNQIHGNSINQKFLEETEMEVESVVDIDTYI